MATGKARRRRKVVWALAAVGFFSYVISVLLRQEQFHVSNTALTLTQEGVSVRGQLTNSGERASYVAVEVTFYDSRGREVRKEMVHLKNLARGQTLSFQTPPRLLPDVADYVIYVNTGRNPYGN